MANPHNWRFGRAVDNDNDGLPSQSVSNIDRVMTSSSCLLSLLVSVIFIAVFILPKCPSQKWPRMTSKKSRSYPPRFRVGLVVILCCNAAAVVTLPILPPNEQCVNADCRH